MSVIGKRKIWVGPADGANDKPLVVEGAAADAILPGALVERTSATALATSTQSATEWNSTTYVALEYGDHVDQDVDTPYVVGETAIAGQARSGEFYNVLVADGNNIAALDTPLSSNGDGTLKIAVVPATIGATSEQVLFYSDEIINVSGAAALVCVRKA